MATEAAAKRFFSSSRFAVAGASSNPAKFSHQIFAWYLEHNLDVTPINPTSPSVNVGGQDFQTVPDVKALANPRETSLSIVTPPRATVSVLRDAKSVGISSIWLQPGTYDDEVLKVALEEGAFDAVLYGAGGRGHEGWCVLVDGERALKANGKL